MGIVAAGVSFGGFLTGSEEGTVEFGSLNASNEVGKCLFFFCRFGPSPCLRRLEGS